MIGAQQPRVRVAPGAASRARAREAIELAAAAGLVLDPWQRLVLEDGLGTDEDGRWAALEVAAVVPRQNGKNAILEARELAGLFLFDENLLVHSAHLFDTSLEAFRRLLERIEQAGLDGRLRRVLRSHGEEGVELRDGRRIRFRTRTRGGGRGFSADFVGFDEAMILPEAAHGALLPTLSARPNPQVWYAGSSPDQSIHHDALVLARLRRRALAGDETLAYAEWSLPAASPAAVDDETARDREAWARANPALGVRIDPEHVERERRALDPRAFAVERLGVGDWPDPDAAAEAAVDLVEWARAEDRRSRPVGRVCFAYDVAADRATSSISVAGRRRDGRWHVEVVDRRARTGWLADRLSELRQRHDCGPIAFDENGPGGSLGAALAAAGVPTRPIGFKEHARACGMLQDSVRERSLRHLGQPGLTLSLRTSGRRARGETWTWARTGADTSIVAATLALWALATEGDGREPMVSFG